MIPRCCVYTLQFAKCWDPLVLVSIEMAILENNSLSEVQPKSMNKRYGVIQNTFVHTSSPLFMGREKRWGRLERGYGQCFLNRAEKGK